MTKEFSEKEQKLIKELSLLKNIRADQRLREKIKSDLITSISPRSKGAFIFKPALLSLLISFFAGAGLALATYQSGPGDILYPAKKTLSWVQTPVAEREEDNTTPEMATSSAEPKEEIPPPPKSQVKTPPVPTPSSQLPSLTNRVEQVQDEVEKIIEKGLQIINPPNLPLEIDLNSDSNKTNLDLNLKGGEKE